jgi:hypothetical protein
VRAGQSASIGPGSGVRTPDGGSSASPLPAIAVRVRGQVIGPFAASVKSRSSLER